MDNEYIIYSEKKILDYINTKMKDNEIFCLSIRNNDNCIGAITYWDIDWESRNSLLTISIGKIDGNDVLINNLLLWAINFGFYQLNLKKIYGYINERNFDNIRICENLGFKKEAILRESIFVNGKYTNQYIFTLLNSNYAE